MSRIEWDKTGGRFYEAGVDRGVLYPETGPGVAWNGLISVNQTPSGGESNPLYLDGLKYENLLGASEFEATLEAYTYPNEFATIMGDETSGSGLYFGQQPGVEFGLAYRTMIGNDAEGSDAGYKIHLIYNALATPSSDSHQTIADTVSPSKFTWTISTRGVVISGRRPTAELIIDSRNAPSSKLNALMDILYGTVSSRPRLPSLEEVVDLFDDWPFLEIIENTITGYNSLKYKSKKDLQGNNRTGLYAITKESRLTPKSPGLYSLER